MDEDRDRDSATPPNTQRAGTVDPPSDPRVGVATTATIMAAIAEGGTDNLDELLTSSIEWIKQLEDELQASLVSS